MNSELRGVIYRKHMFYSQYTKNRNTKTWEKFRKIQKAAKSGNKIKKEFYENLFS